MATPENLSSGDQDFLDREQRYYAHMERFIHAHQSASNGDILIELERRERWEKTMGPYANICSAPTREMVAAAARRRGMDIE